MTRAAVVGGGVGGLLTAWRLAQTGRQVTLYEASSRLGGQVVTQSFAGYAVDLGAESLFVAMPHVRALVDELGLSDRMVPARSGTTWLVTPRGLRALPAGVGPTGPTQIRPVVGSQVLSLAGLVRAGLEPVTARRRVADDISVGTFVRRRFGHQVADRFVDPLLGSLHSGDIDRLSLTSVAPQLVESARQGRSLILKRTPARSVSGATFGCFPGGLGEMVDALVRAAQDSGVVLCTGWPVTSVVAGDAGYALSGPAGADLVDELVVAVPAARAAALLSPLSDEASTQLATRHTASVANVVVALRRADVAAVPALSGNGMLVGTSTPRHLKAATFLSSKWPHLDEPDKPFLVRMSLGHAGSHVADVMPDTELVETALRDLGELTGLWAQPLETLVVRWPRTMPQLEVGHAAVMASVRAALSRTAERHGLAPLELVGAAYDGTGLAAVIRSAEAGAGRLSAVRTVEVPQREDRA